MEVRDAMTVKELKELLDNYKDNDVVDLMASGTEWASARLYIGNDLVMEYDN